MSDREYVCGRMDRVPDLGVSRRAAPIASTVEDPVAMVKRVAAAVERKRRQMDAARDRVPRGKREPWIKSYLPRQRIELARAAIEALRKMTAPMHRAGHSPLVPHFVEEADAYGMSQRVWEAMIDVALAEGPAAERKLASIERPEGTNNHPPESMK